MKKRGCHSCPGGSPPPPVTPYGRATLLQQEEDFSLYPIPYHSTGHGSHGTAAETPQSRFARQPPCREAEAPCGRKIATAACTLPWESSCASRYVAPRPRLPHQSEDWFAMTKGTACALSRNDEGRCAHICGTEKYRKFKKSSYSCPLTFLALCSIVCLALRKKEC